MLDERIYPLAHQFLQNAPAMLRDDIAYCDLCGELVVKEAERLAKSAKLKRSAGETRCGILSAKDVLWNQSPGIILNGFSERLLRNHDQHTNLESQW